MSVHPKTAARAKRNQLAFTDEGTIVETKTGHNIEIVADIEEHGTPAKALDYAIETMDEAIATAIEEEGLEVRTLSKCIRPYRAKYAPHGDSCGDDLHHAIKAFITVEERDPETGVAREHADLKLLRRLVEQNNVEYRWDHLNPGQQRMCAGNVLRGMLMKGQPVKVGKAVIQQKVAAEKKVAKAA